MTVLRQGERVDVLPDHPGVIGDDPICADAVTMKWSDDWAAHKAKLTNAKPGIAYMYAGGTDSSGAIRSRSKAIDQGAAARDGHVSG